MNKENNFKYDTINEEVSIPFMITWDILRRCSFDCTYCPPHRHDLVSPYPSRKELDDVSHFLIDYLKIIKKYRVSDEFNISLTGGEPTIYPEFIEFAEYLKSTQVYNSEYGGVVERAVEYAKEDTMQQIGQMLEEVLNMTEEQLDKELDDEEIIE